MNRNDGLAKALAVVGTVLAWFPLFATVVIAVIGSVQRHMILVDYLMPAELFPAAFLGGALLLWAALRARANQKLIAWSLGLAVALLVIGLMVLPTVTGLASGETEPTGLPWALVMISLVAYVLALIALDYGGLLLLRDLFQPGRSDSA